MLAKTGPVTYKIQRHPQADPEIVHVDKLIPYYPDFEKQLYSWIETDCPVQYRDQEIQTSQPVLQDQELNTVDISPPMHDPVDALAPMPDPAPTAAIAEPHIDIPSTTEEPVEMEKSFTASPAQPEVSPAVLEAPLESPSGPDQELSVDLTESPEVETDPVTCPADVSSQPQSTPAESDGPVAESEDEPTDKCVNPFPQSHEIPAGSRSLLPLPRKAHDRANSQRDTPQSEDYKSCQSPRHKMFHLLAVPEYRHSCHAQREPSRPAITIPVTQCTNPCMLRDDV